MKRLISFLLGVIFLTGCFNTGRIIVKKDEFRGTSQISLELKETAEERSNGLLSPRFDGHFRYVREVTKEAAEPTKVWLTITANVENEDLSDKGFINIDGQITEITLAGISSKNRSNTTSETTTYHGTNNSGNFDYSKSNNSGFVDYTKNSTKVTTNTWKELKGMIYLTPVIEEKLKSSSSITFRVYSGPDPVTFKCSETGCAKIREFLNTKGI